MTYTYNATITFDGNYYYADFEDFNGQLFTDAQSRAELQEHMKSVLQSSQAMKALILMRG